MQNEVLQISLQDGRTIKYTLRGLKDNEIHSWAQFCATAFCDKDNPPPSLYFERHYHNDPRREAALIRVACTEDGSIVSSCRVFPKTISAGKGRTLEAGGIGEVCTHLDHRKRGLSNHLLHHSMDSMKARGMQTSLLHAAPAFVSVYQRGGDYHCTLTHWSVITMDSSRMLQQLLLRSNVNVRLAEFPKDTARLMKIHHAYSETRFSGMVIRSEQYWNDYIAKELEGTFYVLIDNDVIVGWLSVRLRNGRYQVRDFGCDHTMTETSQVLSTLLPSVIGNVGIIELFLPSAMLEELREANLTYLDWSKERSEDDLGWMYKNLQDDSPDIVAITLDKQSPHLIWPADSF
jgi:Acetyltransferase (GNAT) domain